MGGHFLVARQSFYSSRTPQIFFTAAADRLRGEIDLKHLAQEKAEGTNGEIARVFIACFFHCEEGVDDHCSE